MQLGLRDLRALPLRAALVERDGEVIAATPEWEGVGAACVAYPVRQKRLLVATREGDTRWMALIDELIACLDSSAHDDDDLRMRLRMLIASLRVLAAQDVGADGTAEDALRLAAAGIRARSGAAVDVQAAGGQVTRAPEVVALILVQLAVNAERHDAASALTLSCDGGTFSVAWRSREASSARIATARRHADRTRWGLGFARIAADALGATVYQPLPDENGMVCASIETGIGRLTLPLAAIRHEAVVRATHAWVEETSLTPGAHIAGNRRVAAIARDAGSRPGVIVCHDGWCARSAAGTTWLAVPPDDAAARMHDVLDGLAHEHALLTGVDVATQAHLRALCLTLGACLGRQAPRVPALAWRRRMTTLAPALGLPASIPTLEGVGAVDADLCAALAARTGGRFSVVDDALWLEIPSRAASDPMVRALAPPDVTRIRLG